MIQNIISYSILIYLAGVVSNMIVFYLVPEKYFKESGTSKDTGYIVSWFLPYVFLLTLIYLSIKALIETVKFKLKSLYYRWKLKRMIRKILSERDDLELDDIIEQVDSLSKKESD